jgi:hypothetical protein
MPTTLRFESTDVSQGRTAILGSELPRLQLQGCTLERRAGGRTRVTVAFDAPWLDAPLSSMQEGSTCPGGDLRLAARATLDVLTIATGHRLSFDLVGVKPTRAFDCNVMLVSVVARDGDNATRLLGVAVNEIRQELAAVHATVHAVNRVVSSLLGP